MQQATNWKPNIGNWQFFYFFIFSLLAIENHKKHFISEFLIFNFPFGQNFTSFKKKAGTTSPTLSPKSSLLWLGSTTTRGKIPHTLSQVKSFCIDFVSSKPTWCTDQLLSSQVRHVFFFMRWANGFCNPIHTTKPKLNRSRM